MLTAETIIDLTFPDISSTFTNFSPGLKWGAFLGKILKRKSDICTEGTFLHELYFAKRMRTMQKIHINKNYKLSFDNLARVEFEDDSADNLFCNILICKMTTCSLQFNLKISKYTVSHFKRNVQFLYCCKQCQHYKLSVELSKYDIHISRYIKHVMMCNNIKCDLSKY